MLATRRTLLPYLACIVAEGPAQPPAAGLPALARALSIAPGDPADSHIQLGCDEEREGEEETPCDRPDQILSGAPPFLLMGGGGSPVPPAVGIKPGGFRRVTRLDA